MSSYIATCQDEQVTEFGEGDTPEDALQDFLNNGEFEEYCSNQCVEIGELVEITVSRKLTRKEVDTDELEMMENEGWEWILDSRAAMTRQAEYRGDGDE